jgi:hypothetical protein
MSSAKLNFALRISAKEGFFSLADAKPYGDLLGAKYARAINKLEPAKNKIQVTDLGFATFDDLISEQRLEKLILGTPGELCCRPCRRVLGQTAIMPTSSISW